MLLDRGSLFLLRCRYVSVETATELETILELHLLSVLILSQCKVDLISGIAHYPLLLYILCTLIESSTLGTILTPVRSLAWPQQFIFDLELLASRVDNTA